MEKTQIIALINTFDDFVQRSLQRKASFQPTQQLQSNQVENYKLGMEKRLKLKPPSHQQKFQKMLGPMKDLKSFVSVKEFMEKLGTNKNLGQAPKISQIRPQSDIKQQYESARGGYYLGKIQDHLKRHNYKRQNKSPFVTSIDTDPLCPSEFKTWMEEALDRISPKQQEMFRSNIAMKLQEKVSQEDYLLEEHKKNYHQQFKVVSNIHNVCSQQYQNFTKISSLLTARLRKLLKPNFASRSSKAPHQMQPARSEPALTKRGLSRRTETGRFKQESQREYKRKEDVRVKTAGYCRKQEGTWRQNLNKKIKLIIEVQDQE